MAFPLSWKLRVDQDGLARRLLFLWDVWSWGDLASGRLSKLYPYTLHDPERPWWRRKLRLEYMASDDLQEVLSVINSHYKLPPPPEVPASLTIMCGLRCSATLDGNGIHVMVRDTPYEYVWRDVSEIHITRMDHLSRDFESLAITLPDRELELNFIRHQHGSSPTWRGATSEEINEFLLHVVPSDRIHGLMTLWLELTGKRMDTGQIDQAVNQFLFSYASVAERRRGN